MMFVYDENTKVTINSVYTDSITALQAFSPIKLKGVMPCDEATMEALQKFAYARFAEVTSQNVETICDEINQEAEEKLNINPNMKPAFTPADLSHPCFISFYGVNLSTKFELEFQPKVDPIRNITYYSGKRGFKVDYYQNANDFMVSIYGTNGVVISFIVTKEDQDYSLKSLLKMIEKKYSKPDCDYELTYPAINFRHAESPELEALDPSIEIKDSKAEVMFNLNGKGAECSSYAYFQAVARGIRSTISLSIGENENPKFYVLVSVLGASKPQIVAHLDINKEFPGVKN